jgi:hypothetical protein
MDLGVLIRRHLLYTSALPELAMVHLCSICAVWDLPCLFPLHFITFSHRIATPVL